MVGLCTLRVLVPPYTIRPGRMSISIIIPTLNEASTIADTVAKARAIDPDEIIVVDGGSTDDTVAQAAGADQVLIGPRGRAAQQNCGAAAATGEVMLFLHADCWLEPGSLTAVSKALSDEHCVGGCFRQRIEAEGRRYRWLEWGNAHRVQWWQLAYGDQGIFVRRSVFERLGGFPPLALMEDLFFMKRLRREGRFALLDGPLHVSARRWQQQGVVRQTARNWFLTGLAQLGVSPDRLARLYPLVR
ncbi:MAG: glycosyltransferase [Planctomycetaceae bacterium]|nr:glycosyltransferase [Planctomycetaceae bacterium]